MAPPDESPGSCLLYNAQEVPVPLMSPARTALAGDIGKRGYRCRRVARALDSREQRQSAFDAGTDSEDGECEECGLGDA